MTLWERKELTFYRIVLLMLALAWLAFADSETLRPSAVGDLSAFTSVGTESTTCDDAADPDWQCIDEVNQDGDTSRLEATTSATTLVNITDMVAATPTITNVTLYGYCKRGTSQNAQYILKTKTGGTEYPSSSITCDNTYGPSADSLSFNTNPNTGAAWTKTEVNALQVGVAWSLRTPRVTQLYVVVSFDPHQLNQIGTYGISGDNQAQFAKGCCFGTTPTPSTTNPAKVSFYNNSACSTGEVIQCDYDTDTGQPTCTSWANTKIDFTSETTGMSDGTNYARVTLENGSTSTCKSLVVDNKAPTISGTSTKDRGNSPGILTNMASPPASPSGWTTSANAKLGNSAMEFDGTNDLTKHGKDIAYGAADAFCVEAWFKQDTTGANRVIVARANGAGTLEGWVLFIDSSNFLRLRLRQDSTNFLQFIGSTARTDTASFHHIMATYDGTATNTSINVYYDNGAAEAGTTTDTGFDTTDNISTTYEFTTGSFGEGSGYWNGIVDNVAIWSKNCSTTDRSNSWNSGNGRELVGNETSLKAYLPFNEGGTGTYASDGKLTTLESATVFHKDSIFIDLGVSDASGSATNQIKERCIGQRYLDAVSVRDTASAEVANVIGRYDLGNGIGRIRLDPPSTGWPTANNPLKVRVTTGFKDCAGNALASQFDATSGFTSSTAVTNILPGADSVLLGTVSEASYLRHPGSKMLYDGLRYFLFVPDLDTVKYAVSQNEQDWTAIIPLPGTIDTNTGQTFDVSFGQFYGNWIIVAGYNRARAFSINDKDPEFLEPITDSLGAVSDCGTYATTVLATAIAHATRVYMAYIDVNQDVYFCESNGTDGMLPFASQVPVDNSGVTNYDGPVAVIAEPGAGRRAMILASAGTTLYAWFWDGTSISSRETVTTSLAATAQWIVTQTYNYVHVLYRDSSNNLKHRYRTKGCSTTCYGTDYDTGINLPSMLLAHAYSTWQDKDGLTIGFLDDNGDGDAINDSLYTTSYDGLGTASTDWTSATLYKADLVITAGQGLTGTPYLEWNGRTAFAYNNLNGSVYDVRVTFFSQSTYINYSGGVEIANDANGTGVGALGKYWRSAIYGSTAYIFYIQDSGKMPIRTYGLLTNSVSEPFNIWDIPFTRDNHIGPNASIDSVSKRATVILGGRQSGSDLVIPLYYRETLLPVDDANFKLYMWGPLIDTGLTSSTHCNRGYKWIFQDGNGVHHLFCNLAEGGEVYNDINGSWLQSQAFKFIDSSCMTNEYNYLMDVGFAPDESFGIMWTDTALPEDSVDHAYYFRLVYDFGTNTYPATRADGTTSQTLPALPDKTGCTTNSETILTSDIINGISQRARITFTDSVNPLITYIADTSATAANTLRFSKYIGSWTHLNLTDTDVDEPMGINHPGGSSQDITITYNPAGTINYKKSNDLGSIFGSTNTLITDSDIYFKQVGDLPAAPYADYIMLYQFRNKVLASTRQGFYRSYQPLFLREVELSNFVPICKAVGGC